MAPRDVLTCLTCRERIDPSCEMLKCLRKLSDRDEYFFVALHFIVRAVCARGESKKSGDSSGRCSPRAERNAVRSGGPLILRPAADDVKRTNA